MAWFGLKVLSLQPSPALEVQCLVKASPAAPLVALTVPLAPSQRAIDLEPTNQGEIEGSTSPRVKAKNHPNSITSQHQDARVLV